jgi:hypothetical protein
MPCPGVFVFTHDLTAPGKRIDPFAAGEHVTEMRLIAEAAIQADLRQAQVVADQQLGASNALLANPVLRREAGAALNAREKWLRDNAQARASSATSRLSPRRSRISCSTSRAPWAEAADKRPGRFAGRAGRRIAADEPWPVSVSWR